MTTFRPYRRILPLVATIALMLSGCATTNGDNQMEQVIIQNEIAGDNPDFEAQIDNAKQDMYEESLFNACWDANAGIGWSEDDLYAYCDEHLYDFEDFGANGGAVTEPQIDEINDCSNGSLEIYLFSYSTPEGSDEVSLQSMCRLDAEMGARQMAPPGVFLNYIGTI